MKLWQVTTHYMCAGVLTGKDDTVVKAAPILTWTIGKHIKWVEAWAKKKYGTVKFVEET